MRAVYEMENEFKMNNILEILEETVKNHSEKIAVDDGEETLKWRELLELSRRYGTTFARKTDRNKPVAILMEKSAKTLSVMFGVVYAGCFYVMIDPSQPAERLRQILSVLSPELVITKSEFMGLLKEADYEKEIYLADEVIHTGIDEELLTGIRKESKVTDLLYGIFTSGSTGIPKGIVVSQKAVVDFISHFVEIFRINEEDRIGNQAPFDFDVSVKDIYSAVMTGATLVLVPKKLFCSPAILLDYLCNKKVTNLTWAVSALTLISSLKGLSYKVPKDVKRVMFSGEVMPVKQLRLWQEALPEAKFVNLYGPSEITCNCTYFNIGRMYEDNEKIPIGKAFPGREVFLMDDNNSIINERDKVGEICVTGESLSEGYYNNPKETEKRFIMYPLHNDEVVRCYRTGDLGYYGEDGELYFSGRCDFQIKHMGHRIELEEIERAINRIDEVDKSVCLMDYKHNYLVAFYQGNAMTEDIHRELKRSIPAYMIPRKLVQTEVFPLNKNGKTDRKYFMDIIDKRKRA